MRTFLKYNRNALLWAFLILALCTMPVSGITSIKLLDLLSFDKLAHMLLFAMLGCCYLLLFAAICCCLLVFAAAICSCLLLVVAIYCCLLLVAAVCCFFTVVCFFWLRIPADCHFMFFASSFQDKN